MLVPEIQNSSPVVDMDRELVLRHINQQRNERARRKKILYSSLKDIYGVQPRQDSRLCRKYIYGENIEISYIANILAEQDWFYKNTNYPSLNQKLQKAHKENCIQDIDPYKIKDMFSSITKNLIRAKIIDTEGCQPEYCLLFGPPSI